LTKAYSGAEIAALVNAAAMSAIKEYVANNRSGSKGGQSQEHDPEKESEKNLIISFEHFECALKKNEAKCQSSKHRSSLDGSIVLA
jgi:SpoVK/Ycf46/Vps4 family AAA+-type ATPase